MDIPRSHLRSLSHFKRVKLSGPDAYFLHTHDFGEIFWLDEGECLHRINGHDIALKEGALVFIRPTDRHSFSGPATRPFYINNICFEWNAFRYLKRRYFPGDDGVYGENEPLPKMLMLSPRQLERARGFFLALFDGSPERLGIERFLISMFSEYCPPAANGSAPPIPAWMKKAWRHIHEPEHFRLGASEFCRLSGRSREHCSREFKRITGRTPGDYTHQLRMKRAATLLEASPSEILDISLDCGFESLSHFYACFRREYGTSPKAFRQEAQGKMYGSIV